MAEYLHHIRPLFALHIHLSCMSNCRVSGVNINLSIPGKPYILLLKPMEHLIQVNCLKPTWCECASSQATCCIYSWQGYSGTFVRVLKYSSLRFLRVQWRWMAFDLWCSQEWQMYAHFSFIWMFEIMETDRQSDKTAEPQLPGLPQAPPKPLFLFSLPSDSIQETTGATTATTPLVPKEVAPPHRDSTPWVPSSLPPSADIGPHPSSLPHHLGSPPSITYNKLF